MVAGKECTTQGILPPPSGWGVIAYLCTEGNNADCICCGRTYMKLIAMIASGGSNCETRE